MKREERFESASTVDDRLLRDFADGRLEDAEAERIAGLIEGSPELQSRLARLSASPIVKAVQKAARTSFGQDSNSLHPESPNTLSGHSDSSLSQVSRSSPLAGSITNSSNAAPRVASSGEEDERKGAPLPEQAPSVKNSFQAQNSSPRSSNALQQDDLISLLSQNGYQVEKELGRGGMGVVYLAKNIAMDRHEVLGEKKDTQCDNRLNRRTMPVPSLAQI